MLTPLAFIVALGILIAIHEYGHYRVAVACGVKVLKFSVGFGRPIYTWRLKNSPTEFAIGILPLGGYVKMLDEREDPVDPAERHMAFNNRPLLARTAVVAAGPLANLLLAVTLYTLLNWTGLQEPRALLASPGANSVAEKAGLVGGELVLQAALDDEELDEVRSFDDLRWHLTQGALNGQRLKLVVVNGLAAGPAPSSASGLPTREVILDLGQVENDEVNAALFRAIGITTPWSRPLIAEVMPDGAASKAGLQAGDLVLRINERVVVDGQQLREIIRSSAAGSSAQAQAPGQAISAQQWRIERAGQVLELAVTPQVQQEGGNSVARIGAFVGEPPQMLTVRYGVLDGVANGFAKTWDVSILSLKMMGKMLVGDASLKNLSGPLTIADYAGKSANLGWSAYLLFLAMISVSLGVLNLLPLPVLDGGHLMYYLWEGLTGKPVSEAWMNRFQRGGVAVLVAVMSIAFFNDLMRIFG